MIEQALLLKLSTQNLTESTTSQLRQEYQAYQRLFKAQSDLVQQFLNHQAAVLADGIVNGVSPLHYSLPEHVLCLPAMDCTGVDEKIPAQDREHRVGSIIDRLTHPNLSLALSHQLSELEKSASLAISAGAGLTRYALATYMIYHLVPEGKPVVYAATEDDDTPNQPVHAVSELTINDFTGAPIEYEEVKNSRQLVATNAAYARGFYLPQWVVFDDHNRLLAGNVEEAHAHINAMRRYLSILNSALGLAPYMVVDEAYQYKHYGILGQLVNQGRALASYQVDIICQTIKQRSATHRLDRGFSLSLPYFNDKTLAIEQHDFDVIPKGRVMFVPAFVVLAVRAEGLRIAQNLNLNRSTRRHLLQELIILEKAFIR